ncbi:MAG: hypothetical protein LC808_13150 [Actinobacteria bacterium]|nr:hypothetical protein [Actinomycetota bacterium]
MVSSAGDRPLVGIDLDNVVGDTDSLIRELIEASTGVRLRREDIVNFDYWRCGIAREQSDAVLKTFHDGACASVLPLDGAVSALVSIGRHAAINIITARPVSSDQVTRTWLAENGVPFDSLIFSSHKIEIARSHHYNAFVEDHRETAYALAREGIRTFIVDYPWNQPEGDEPPLAARVASWVDLERELLRVLVT